MIRRPLFPLLAAATLAAPLPAGEPWQPELVRLGHAEFAPGTWLISEWPAGQSRITAWDAGMVRRTGEGVELRLEAAGTGADRPMKGGEIQSHTAARTGTWRWRAKVPEMVEGAVFGMFLYKADQKNHPWREYDIEFVGEDTTKLQLNIFFESEDGGSPVTLGQGKGGPVTVDLGFDAAEGFHDYAITVGEQSAEFFVDGRSVGAFGPEDMPGETWNPGPLRAFADLWAASPNMADWAGEWTDPGRPLTAVISEMDVPEAG